MQNSVKIITTLSVSEAADKKKPKTMANSDSEDHQNSKDRLF